MPVAVVHDHGSIGCSQGVFLPTSLLDKQLPCRRGEVFEGSFHEDRFRSVRRGIDIAMAGERYLNASLSSPQPGGIEAVRRLRPHRDRTSSQMRVKK